MAVSVFVFIAMFFADWKLALLSLLSLPLGFVAMGIMYRQGMGKMSAYYAAAKKMNNTIVEYINGMEVVKVFNRDGDSYRRYEMDVKNYRDFTLDWYRIGAWFVLREWSALPQVNYKIESLEKLMRAPLLKQTEKTFTGNDHSVSFGDVRLDYRVNGSEGAREDGPCHPEKCACRGAWR